MTYDDIKERFTFDVERYVLDYNGGGYNLIFTVLGGGRRCDRRGEVTHRGRTT